MANKRMENWDAGDFGQHFRTLAATSVDARFQERFTTLAKALEPLDREFCRETAACGRNLSAVMDELQGIAGREGYCSRPRGFDDDCDVLFEDVGRSISRVEALREVCFL